MTDGYELWQVRTSTGRINNFATKEQASDWAQALRGEGRKCVGLLTRFPSEMQAKGYPEFSFSGMYSFFDSNEEMQAWMETEEAAAVMGGLF